jgi:hypothetical protein
MAFDGNRWHPATAKERICGIFFPAFDAVDSGWKAHK